ncbi:MAG: hypothetical protein ABEJ05_09205 [Haloglomus sp.]
MAEAGGSETDDFEAGGSETDDFEAGAPEAGYSKDGPEDGPLVGFGPGPPVPI